MEETNFNRKHVHDATLSSQTSPGESILDKKEKQEPYTVTTAPVPEGQPKTFWQKLALFDKANFQPVPLWTIVIRPVILLVRFPIVLWSGFLYGSSLVIFNILNATTSLILGGAPYNFAPSMVGLAYLGPLIGTAIG
jgi:hypothetical protein